VKLIGLLLVLAGALSAETYTYWVEPCAHPEMGCETNDIQLAEWAFQAWHKASGGAVEFVKSPLSKARIRLYWASNASNGLYGETRAIEVNGRSGAELNVRPTLGGLGQKIEEEGNKDRIFRDSVVYLTCLHELGHALGLQHTHQFADIMYSFEFGGNIHEYFSRYRRKLQSGADFPEHSGLSADDEKHMVALYKGDGADPVSGLSGGGLRKQQSHTNKP
jgi:hypothetical protein